MRCDDVVLHLQLSARRHHVARLRALPGRRGQRVEQLALQKKIHVHSVNTWLSHTSQRRRRRSLLAAQRMPGIICKRLLRNFGHELRDPCADERLLCGCWHDEAFAYGVHVVDLLRAQVTGGKQRESGENLQQGHLLQLLKT